MLGLNNLQQWLLESPLGRHVLATEEVFYHNNVQNIFGYYAVQIGMPQINFLSRNKIPSRFYIDSDIKCDIRFLPFASSSIDLIICPHTLELTENYHHFLQECYRILIPRGKIIISNFNHKSLFGLFGKYNPVLKQTNYISVSKLQQQLNTLNFNICGGRFFDYRPPINNSKYLSHCAFLDKIGDRWFPTFANSYAIIASKELVTPTIIGSKTKLGPKPVFAPNLGLAGKIYIGTK